LGEHQLDKLGVTGSSPVPPTPAIPLLQRFCGTEGKTGRARFVHRTRDSLRDGRMKPDQIAAIVLQAVNNAKAG
jgi:hypothetical protein